MKIVVDGTAYITLLLFVRYVVCCSVSIITMLLSCCIVYISFRIFLIRSGLVMVGRFGQIGLIPLARHAADGFATVAVFLSAGYSVGRFVCISLSRFAWIVFGGFGLTALLLFDRSSVDVSLNVAAVRPVYGSVIRFLRIPLIRPSLVVGYRFSRVPLILPGGIIACGSAATAITPMHFMPVWPKMLILLPFSIFLVTP